MCNKNPHITNHSKDKVQETIKRAKKDKSSKKLKRNQQE